MTIIDLICEDFSIKFLIILIGIVQLLHIFINNNIEDKGSDVKNNKVHTIKPWMLIMHLIVLTGIFILILKIKILLNLITLLCIPFYISILIMCFIQIIKNVKKIRKEEFTEFETNSFLYFSYLVLLFFNKKIQGELENYLVLLQNNHQTIFECTTLILLFFKTFFLSFFGLYALLMIIRYFKKIINKLFSRVHINFKFFKKIYNLFTNDELYIYDFALFNKYKKIKFLIPFLFVIDLTILIIYDILFILIFFIRYPIGIVIVIFRYINKFFNNITTLNISIFTFKWFRIMIIFSISFTYIILKILKINISQNIMDIFELISTVILIPLIFEQLFSNKEKLEN